MNPGSGRAPLESEEEAAKNKDSQDEDFSRFGLMESFVRQWAKRLPLALALGAGEHIKLPPGNMELIHVLEPFDRT